MTPFNLFLTFPLHVHHHLHRAMVRPVNLRMYARADQFLIQPIGYKKIVDAPTGILLACPETVGPPGVDVLLVRIEIAEGIGETGCQQLAELAALLVREAGIATVGLGIL